MSNPQKNKQIIWPSCLHTSRNSQNKNDATYSFNGEQLMKGVANVEFVSYFFFKRNGFFVIQNVQCSFALELVICVDIIDHYSVQKRRNDHLDPYFAIIVLIYFKFSFIHYLMSRINKLDHDHHYHVTILLHQSSRVSKDGANSEYGILQLRRYFSVSGWLESTSEFFIPSQR